MRLTPARPRPARSATALAPRDPRTSRPAPIEPDTDARGEYADAVMARKMIFVANTHPGMDGEDCMMDFITRELTTGVWARVPVADDGFDRWIANRIWLWMSRQRRSFRRAKARALTASVVTPEGTDLDIYAEVSVTPRHFHADDVTAIRAACPGEGALIDALFATGTRRGAAALLGISYDQIKRRVRGIRPAAAAALA